LVRYRRDSAVQFFVFALPDDGPQVAAAQRLCGRLPFIHHNVLRTAAMQKLLFLSLTALVVLAGSPAEATVLCGGGGCNVVQTKPLQHRKFQTLGYTKPLQQQTPPAATTTPITSLIPKL
jgi:hypothetical protein